MKLWADLETRSPIPLKHGIAKYATRVEIIVLAWAVDDGPVRVEDLTRGAPSRVFTSTAERADEVWAHNAEFDRTVLETTQWWPTVPLEKWRCTAAMARMHGLPAGLDKLCQIFKLPKDEAKDKRGHQLIARFCIPNAEGKYNDGRSHPKEWEEFLGYGGQDVVAMRAIHKHTPKWNATPRMWAVWHLDQKMNERGVRVDLALAQGAVTATTRAKRRMAARTAELTTDLITGEVAVEATTQRARMLAYMADFGVDLPDLTADTVERRLEDESLPVHIKELLRVRQQASKASTAKYQRALNQHVSGRLRNLLVFCGAGRTGRWAGRTLQPHNLPRPKHEQWDIAEAIKRFHTDTIDAYAPDEVLGLASSCLRGIIIAAEDHKLVVSDYANIEGRDMAWVAGEQWKLDAFAAYDRKEGPDLYKVAYARSFNIDPYDIADEGDDRRQIGKVMELALQYYGGVGAFCSMADTYGLRLETLADSAWPVIPDATKAEARAAWDRAVRRHRTYGLAERVWVVCHSLVLLWRAAHPAICAFWAGLEQARAMAVKNPGKQYPVGRVVVDRKGAWLRIKLPSGRYLNYPGPKDAEFEHSFMGMCPYTKQWKRLSSYSGKDAENVVQGIAADHMMDGLLAAEDAGYNPVLSVHDEALTEPPNDPAYNDKHLSKLLVESSLWADGLPLAAKGFTAKRYRK